MSSTSISPFQPDLESKAPASRNGGDPRHRGEIEILIVDDHRPAQYNLWALLRRKQDIRVTGTANSSAEAVTLAKRRRPHACLISATLSGGEALTLTSRMKRLTDPPRVLIFADAVDQYLACAATVAGADGVIWRYADPDEQAEVIRHAATGEQHFPDLEPKEILALLDHVDDRDRAIVAMLLEHARADHIASLLGISAHSLELRRQGILERLGPTCGMGPRRQDDDAHPGTVAPESSGETRPSDDTGAPERKAIPTNDHQMTRRREASARGSQPPALPDGQHPESSPPAECQQTQTLPATGVSSQGGLGSLAALVKRADDATTVPAPSTPDEPPAPTSPTTAVSTTPATIELDRVPRRP